MTVTRAYEVDASSMCDVLSGVPGVDDVSLEFDTRGNGVLRVRLRPDVDEDAVVGAAVAQLHRRFGVGMEGGRLRLTGPSGRTVVAVVEPHGRPQPRRAPRPVAPPSNAAASRPAADERPIKAPAVDPGPADSPVAEPPVDGRPADLSVVGPAVDASPGDPPVAELVVDGRPADPPAGGRVVDVPGLAEEPVTPPMPERRTLERTAADVRPGGAQVRPEQAVPELQPELESHPEPEPEPQPASEVEPQPEPAPGPGPEPPHLVERLVLERVEVATGRLELWAAVELSAGDERHTGTASATATGTGAHRAVVTATARAAESALGGAVRIDVEAVDLLGVGADQVGVVVVTLLTERGVDRVSGAALVRGDGRETLVRATLDALNRRTRSLPQGHPAPPS